MKYLTWVSNLLNELLYCYMNRFGSGFVDNEVMGWFILSLICD